MGRADDQAYMIQQASEQQAILLMKILKQLERLTALALANGSPVQEFEQEQLPIALDLQDHP